MMSSRRCFSFLWFSLLIFFHTLAFQPFVQAAPPPKEVYKFNLDPVKIQEALNKAGYYSGPIDGIIGRKTREAIRTFQRKNDLAEDGVCGPKTWAKLKTFGAPAADEKKEELPKGEELLEPFDVKDYEEQDWQPEEPFESSVPSLQKEDLRQKLVA